MTAEPAVHEARWWRPLPGTGSPPAVACQLCPQACRIPVDGAGLCRYRRNADGRLLAANYGLVSAMGYDPIEKKPLYHFLPGRQIFSIGTLGCNLACSFCQNWRISQNEAPVESLSPLEAAALAGGTTPAGEASVGIAYTYSEPIVWWEYVYDTAVEVRRRGLVNVLVTNGFIQPEPLAELLPLIDALNVDVKAFTEGFYREVCGGRLAPVLRTVETAWARGAHVEVTALLVPGLNDDPGELKALASWLATIDRRIPLHLSRYFPNYRLRSPGATPPDVLRRSLAIAREHLDFVYVGNAFEVEAAATVCPACGHLVIRRDGYRTATVGLAGADCAACGRRILADPHKRDVLD